MLKQQVQFISAKEPFEVIPHLTTTGEILDRSEKDGTEPRRAWHKSHGKWESDPIVDDLSLVLEAQDGLVIIGGCCHAGILNTCAHVSKMFDERIHAFIGGSHMLHFTRDEVSHVADVLEQTYGPPQLYLNHCTGKKTMAQVREQFGSEIAHDCRVGTELTYEIN